ncbi:LamG domain-containing protein [Candidatus Woesearchaeota archaeon]|nr:LamG domain-containing protein [Candidatus Woesearchaeota archaeon]
MKNTVKYFDITIFVLVFALFSLTSMLNGNWFTGMAISNPVNFDNTCTNITINQSDSLNQGLVLYFHFDKLPQYGESNNLVCDFSGNDNVAVVENAVWGQAGKFNGSFDFNGVNTRIIVPDSAMLSPSTTGKFTATFFVKFTNTVFSGGGGTNDYLHYMGKGSSSQGYEWVFRQYNGSNPSNRPNRLSFYAFNLTGGWGAGSYVQEPINTSQWVFMTGVIDGTHTKIYKNGVLKDQDPLSGYGIVMQDGSAPLVIGTSDGNSYFKGTVDELRVYNRALTTAEINQIYQLSIDQLYNNIISLEDDSSNITNNTTTNETNSTTSNETNSTPPVESQPVQQSSPSVSSGGGGGGGSSKKTTSNTSTTTSNIDSSQNEEVINSEQATEIEFSTQSNENNDENGYILKDEIENAKNRNYIIIALLFFVFVAIIILIILRRKISRFL